MRWMVLAVGVAGCSGGTRTDVDPTATDPTDTETATVTVTDTETTQTPTTPPTPGEIDVDGDGYASDVDCNDDDDEIFPGAPEVAADGIDQDCDAVDHCYPDADGDGHGAEVATAGSSLDCGGAGEAVAGDDCDDAEPTMFPGNREWCDGLDNDCNTVVDPYCFDFSSADATITDSDTSFPWALAVGDYDHDGVDEVAVSGFFSSRVYLLDGLPSGSQAVTSIAQNTLIGGGALSCFGCSLGSADLDGDGYPELVTPQSTDDLLSIFEEASAVGAGGQAGVGNALASIVGDEDGLMSLYEAITAGDFDDDGVTDLAIPQIADLSGPAGTWKLLSGPFEGALDVADAYATLSRADTSVDLGHAGVAGDFDDDGVDDLAVGSKLGSEVFVFYGPITADLDTANADVVLTGAAGSGAGETLVVGDFDGDGTDDLAIGGTGTHVVYVKHAPFKAQHDLTTDAEFRLTGSGGLGHQESSLAAADVDGDGADDLLVTARDAGVGGEVAVMFGTNLGGAYPDLPLAEADMFFDSASADVGPQHVRVADLDDDGDDEFIVVGPAAGTVYVWDGSTIGL